MNILSWHKNSIDVCCNCCDVLVAERLAYCSAFIGSALLATDVKSRMYTIKDNAMINKEIVRVILAGTLLALGSMLSVAHATSISGKFTLVQDEGTTPGFNVLPGDAVAAVSFDAEATMFTTGGSDIFNVTRLEFSDLTALLDNNANGSFGDDPGLIGDFLYEPAGMGSSISPTGGVSALFDIASGVFVGLSGTIMETSPFGVVSFSAAGVSLSGGSATVIAASGYGDSFALVPEPSILMLFGAGLIAVGFGKGRFKAA